MSRRGEQLAFRGAGFPKPPSNPPPPPPGAPVKAKKGSIPTGEVATVQRAEFLASWNLLYPNPSRVLRFRGQGLGLRFWQTMIEKDDALAAQFENHAASILKCPRGIRAASDDPKHKMHARFVRYAFGRLPKFQAYLRHKLTAYAFGFSVTERVYEIAREGEFAGAIVYASLLDKPAEWFQFDPDRRLLFVNFDNPFPGELVDQTKFSISTWGSVSNPYGVPMCGMVYTDWFLKQHALKNEAIYMEGFASPTAVAGYTASKSDGDANDERMRRGLEVAIAFQNNNAVAKPKDLDLELVESARSTAISFSQYIERLDENIARAVSGATLASMASSGHSFGQARTHESKNVDRTEMAADWLEAEVSDDEVRDLIDRNFGPQEAYPQAYIHAKSAGERQAEIEIEMSEVELGHEVSRSRSAYVLQIEEPEEDGDKLAPLPGINLPQPLPVQQGLAGDRTPTARLRDRRIAFAAWKGKVAGAAEAETIEFAFRHSRDAYTAARRSAESTRSALSSIGASAKKAARPALRRVIASAAKPLAKRKSLAGVTRGDLYGGISKVSGMGALGSVFGTMFSRAASHVRMAADGEDPRQLPATAKIALALEVVAIYDRIYKAAADAGGMTPSDFVESLTSPEGIALDETFANLFDNTHDTDIATIEAANLHRQLASESFRREFPYVMVINANPSPSSSDRYIDGWVVASDEAYRNPAALPPYHFGCQCVAVPIAATDAAAAGFAGTFPLGTMQSYASSRGASPYAAIGTAPGFEPANADTHTVVTLSALRQKVYDIQAEDPFAWASLVAWLTWLFGVDVLRENPKEDSYVAA